MKFTVDRIENNLAICEYEQDGEILTKEFTKEDIPFEITEGAIFTAEQSDEGWIFSQSQDDRNEADERKKRVRNKLNMLFGNK